MAANSKREKIILRVVQEVEEIESIKTVVRKLQAYSDLQEFAVTQMPVVAVVGKLPVPRAHVSGRRAAQSDKMISALRVDLFVYFQEVAQPDSFISSLLDDFWVKLYNDQAKGGLVMSTSLRMAENPGYWNPFVAFNVICEFEYFHTTGGI